MLMTEAGTMGELAKLMTVTEFWSAEMPASLEMLDDRDAEMVREAERAKALAAKYGVKPLPCGRFPRAVLEILYA